MTSATNPAIRRHRPVTSAALLLLAGMGALLAGCQSPGRESPELARQRAEAAAEAPAATRSCCASWH